MSLLTELHGIFLVECFKRFCFPHFWSQKSYFLANLSKKGFGVLQMLMNKMYKMIILRLSEVKIVHQSNVSLFKNYIKLKIYASQTAKRNPMALSLFAFKSIYYVFGIRDSNHYQGEGHAYISVKVKIEISHFPKQKSKI